MAKWRIVCRGKGRLVAAWLLFVSEVVSLQASEIATSAPVAMWQVSGEGRGTPTVIGSAVYFLSKHHELVSIDIATATVNWRRGTGEPGESTSGSRVASNGRDVLVVGDQNLIAFGVDGRTRWRFVPDDGYGAGMQLGVIAGDLVLAGSPAGRLYAVDAYTGRRRWSLPVDAADSTTVFAPIVDGQDVIAGFSTFGETPRGGVVVADLATGRERWRGMFPASEVAMGFSGGPVVTSDEVIAAARDGAIHVFDRKTGAHRWSWPPMAGGWFGSEAASLQDRRPLIVAGTTLVAGSLSGVVIGYNVTDRKERWRATPVDASVGMGLASDGGTAYVPFFSGQIVALDIAAGHERWRTSAEFGGFGWAPLVADRLLFAAGSATGFVAFSLRDVRAEIGGQGVEGVDGCRAPVCGRMPGRPAE